MNHKVVSKCLLVYAGVSPIQFGVQPEFPDNPKFSRDSMKVERSFTNFTHFRHYLSSLSDPADLRDAFYVTIRSKIQDRPHLRRDLACKTLA